MTHGKWTASTDEENWDGEGEWDSEADAIAGGPESLELSPGDTYYVGQTRAPTISVPDADDILEHITCQDDFSLDCAEGAFSCSKEVAAELTDAIQKTFDDWMARHKLEPTFYLIDNYSKHVAPGIPESVSVED
ncbi:hypothetical protein SH661x_001932 [Planctomicrobium sp. SH661]|uniref:hypothetical protein n=1 Tax=Planctomicrobium sp. SH661 TaxID=3448124 RepID=UPI003F5BA98D